MNCSKEWPGMLPGERGIPGIADISHCNQFSVVGITWKHKIQTSLPESDDIFPFQALGIEGKQAMPGIMALA